MNKNRYGLALTDSPHAFSSKMYGNLIHVSIGDKIIDAIVDFFGGGKPNNLHQKVSRVLPEVSNAGVEKYLASSKPTGDIATIEEMYKKNTDYVSQHLSEFSWKKPTGEGRLLYKIVERANKIGVYGVGAALVGAGAWIGHLLPDWDISAFGIGGHRNAMFHSSIALTPAFFLHKWVVRQIGQNPSPVLDLASRGIGLFIGGLALGVSSHLFIDATIEGFKAVLFPLFGSMIGGTLWDDRAWLGGNSLAALYIAYKELSYALGNDNVLFMSWGETLDSAKGDISKVWMLLQSWVEGAIEYLTNFGTSVSTKLSSW